MGKNVTGRRKRFRPCKVHSKQILEVLAHGKFISAGCHAHFNPHSAKNLSTAHIYLTFCKSEKGIIMIINLHQKLYQFRPFINNL